MLRSPPQKKAYHFGMEKEKLELYTSKDLWGEVKATVRQIEQEDGCLIFDDTIQEKAWTDENEIMCWHYDHCKGRSLKASTC
jgi:hypothetical protein